VGGRRSLIAIVDDEDSVRRALQRLMIAAGMDAEVYHGGDDFLAAVAVRKPDCVILDLHMPQVTGFDVQERLAQSPHRVAVIAITGHDSSENEARALALGAAAYLRKPVNAKVLLEAIAAAVGKPQ
jgi:FixJ family two-component response regulator